MATQGLVNGVHDYVPIMKEIGIELYSNAGTPTASGPVKGALVVDTTNGKLYINTGTAASATWDSLGDISASEITLAEGNILVGNNSGVAVALDIGNTDGGIAIGNGTTATIAALSGDVSMTNAGVVTVTGANAAFNVGTNLTLTKEVNHVIKVSATTTADTVGGSLDIESGAGDGTGAGGAFALTSGAGGNSTGGGTGGASGALTIVTGAGGTEDTGTGGAGGTMLIQGGDGGATSGAGGTGGAGASVGLIAGAGGDDSEGASGTGGQGGSVIIQAADGGSGNTTGVDGIIRIDGTTVYSQDAPAAKTTTVTLTAAELIDGLITANQGASGAATYTTPTGTQLTSALATSLANDDSFFFSIINISTDAAEDVTLAAGTDVTLVGDMTVASIDAAGEKASSGRFLARQTAANTWTIYRVA